MKEKPDINADKIKEIRNTLEFSVDEFAQLLKVSSRTVQRWEKEGVNSKQSSGVALLMSLNDVLDDKTSREEFLKVKEKLSLAGSASWGLGISTLSTLTPIFGLLAAGYIGAKLSEQLLKSLNNVVEAKNEK